jgi:RNA polymerase sigma factor (sigma-70 family)
VICAHFKYFRYDEVTAEYLISAYPLGVLVKVQFEEVLKENERIIYHLINKYKIRDDEGEFYQEGIIALWHAMETYDESKAKLSTYIYKSISSKFLNIIKKENRQKEHLYRWIGQVTMDDLLVEDDFGIDPQLYKDIRQQLSKNQWRWFVHFIIKGESIREIANHYSVSAPAVKSWRKCARQKIIQLLRENQYI